MTTEQIACGFFSSLKRAQHRLLRLYRLDLLDRFRTRLRHGSEQWHYVLAHLGARIHAAATEQRPPSRAAVTDAILKLAASPKLEHRLGVNDFFMRILRTSRTDESVKLLAWVDETRASSSYSGHVRPDAEATLRHDGREMTFRFEHDRGTEPLHVLVKKLDRYRVTLQYGPPAPVVFELPNPTRESHLHEQLTEYVYPFAVATTHTAIAADPTAPIWRGLHTHTRRRLIDVDVRMTNPANSLLWIS